MNEQIEKEILELYKIKKPVNDIAKIYNIDPMTVYRVFRKYNLKSYVNYSSMKPIKDDVIKDYREGVSYKEMIKKYNIGSTAISSLIAKNKLKRTNGLNHRRYILYNENYFDIINTEDKAYFLGLFFADGCNNLNGNCAIIELMEEDSYILSYLNKQIYKNKKLAYKKKKKENHKNKFRLDINSKHICEVLNNHGAVPKKSLILLPPKNVPNNLIKHFMRGYFDGDGCIYKGNQQKSIGPTMSILGTKEFCEWFKLELNKILPNRGCLYRRTKNNTFALFFYKKDIFEIYNYFYKNSKIYLKRKKKSFEEAIKIFNLGEVSYD